MTSTLLPRRHGTAAWITVEELAGWMAQGRRFALLDVRTPREFEERSIPASRNLPDACPTEFARRISVDEITVLACRDGEVSRRIACTLDYCGFDRVVYLDGGVNAWTEAGHATLRRHDPATATTVIARIASGVREAVAKLPPVSPAQAVRTAAATINGPAVATAAFVAAAVMLAALFAFAR
jgi:rhodanese-related sulfurtransferase